MKAKLSIIIAIFILFYAGVSRATSIDIKREQTTHHGGMRVPSITKVTADYDDGVVTITLQNYSGTVQIYIYDNNGMLVGTTISTVSGTSNLPTYVQSRSEGKHTLYVVLSYATYSGTFEL